MRIERKVQVFLQRVFFEGLKLPRSEPQPRKFMPRILGMKIYFRAE